MAWLSGPSDGGAGQAGGNPVKLLVAPHELSIGGSQINAIDLAAGAARAGHEVVVYGRPGPLVDYAESRGLEFVAARRTRYRPAPSRIAQLTALARRRGLDLIHAYEWPPCLDAYYGAHLAAGVPLLCTVLSMSVSRYVPPSVPLIMGTEALAEEARRRHRARVWALEPPIDTAADSPSIDGGPLRKALGITDESLLVVTVSRLALELKLDALVDAVDAVDAVAAKLPVALLIVGDGPAGASLRARAAHVNRRWGREAIVFLGSLADPRAAYAAADLVIGMGSSSLRAMAIAKPVIVQGECGFSKVFEPGARDYFLRNGFWGLGDGRPNAQRLADQMAGLLADAGRRAELASYGRRMVEKRFSLARATRLQLGIYDAVLAGRAARNWNEAVGTAWRVAGLELQSHDPRRKRVRDAAAAARLAVAARPAAQTAEPWPA
jgi:L-malate glycosyltransferase